ncbi:hypothetical protein K431DRAFT_260515 [Polychaeton citri CBS 116435]|uniref:FabD/lysophospholipase-like protein n=1 Tax=Polychaeton citri CBS 116435 TaxID=1314669 RepID=A0A9P4QH42_9PEZI|nr:hypothetical protein K431DRAFT_260515 [Polychaeton citri CBS 116435]
MAGTQLSPTYTLSSSDGASFASSPVSPLPNESCEDERCRAPASRVWHCVDCDSNYCEECWAYQGPHKPGKLGRDGVPHEKTSVQLVARLKGILQPPASTERLKQLHQEDRASKWFGMVRDHETGKPTLEDYGRYASLMGSLQPHDPAKSRFPQLVSFIGTTNAGKSTVIKMLVNHMPKGKIAPREFPSPVVGSILHDKVPTSGDVHLYADQSTYPGQLPILYADCEGFEGGERLPLGARSRRKAEDGSAQIEPEFAQARQFPIEWANTDDVSRREYAVTELYPRLLYTFSDVVVFVLRNPKTFQSAVLSKLLEWGASALETSLNQPTLPHAVVLLNDSEPGIDKREWDPHYATKSLLSCLTEALDSKEGVPRFRELAQHWRDLGVPINSIEDLILRYYSTFKVIRMPRKPHYALMERQICTLHDQIKANCEVSFWAKRKARMLTTSEELNVYLQSAFEHYSRTLSTPFNFVQVSWLMNPVTYDFGGHLLQLAKSIAALEPIYRRNAARSRWIFDQMSILIASCVMLDCARHRKGQITDLFDKYREYFQWALNEYCDLSLPCSYQHPDGRHCMLVKARHSTKGHQDVHGIIVAGEYCSDFTAEDYYIRWEAQLKSAIGFVQQEFQDEFSKSSQGGVHLSDEKLAVDLHKAYLSDFYRTVGNGRLVYSHASCLCCLMDVAEHVLPCGHVLCSTCIQNYGEDRGKGVVKMHCCPLHAADAWKHPHRINFKPRGAGTRILCLDGGGIRGIVELEVLRAIEETIGGEIPIQSMFDLITGTGTGGIIATALGIQNWPVSRCIEEFTKLCDSAYGFRISGKGLFDLGAVLGHGSKYKTKAFHKALKEAFGHDKVFFGSHKHASATKVAVTATTSTADRAIVLANYRRREHFVTGYEFERPHEPEAEIKVWEAMAATCAAPTYFRPFVHPITNRTYLDGALLNNNPARLANEERKAIWPDMSDQDPDILLSLGTGQNRISVLPKLTMKTVDKHAVQSKVDDILDAEISWASFRADVVAKDAPNRNTRRFIRFNPDIDRAAPAMDARDQMTSLQMTVRKRLCLPHCVTALKHVAHRLLASCFYFEVKSRSVGQDGFHCFTGSIYCRFKDGSDKVRALGRHLKRVSSDDFQPYLIIKRDNHPDRQEMIDIQLAVVDLMVERATFDMSNVKFTIEDDAKPSSINLVLSSYDGLEPDGFSLSGFPRVLAEDLAPIIAPRLRTTPSSVSSHSPVTLLPSPDQRSSSEHSSLASSFASSQQIRPSAERSHTWTPARDSSHVPGKLLHKRSVSSSVRTPVSPSPSSYQDLKRSNRFWTYIGPAHMAKYPHLYPPDVLQRFVPETPTQVNADKRLTLSEPLPPRQLPDMSAPDARWMQRVHYRPQSNSSSIHPALREGFEVGLTETRMGELTFAVPSTCAPGPAFPPRRQGFDAGELESAIMETLG